MNLFLTHPSKGERYLFIYFLIQKFSEDDKEKIQYQFDIKEKC
jgi:hypothetical protein